MGVGLELSVWPWTATVTAVLLCVKRTAANAARLTRKVVQFATLVLGLMSDWLAVQQISPVL